MKIIATLPNLYINKDGIICFHSSPSYPLPNTYYPLPEQIFSQKNKYILGYNLSFNVLKKTTNNGLNVEIMFDDNNASDIQIICKIIEAIISNAPFSSNEISNLMNENHHNYEYEYEDEKSIVDEEVESIFSEYSDEYTFNR